jgi:outer membrane protein assembly factor BamB
MPYLRCLAALVLTAAVAAAADWPQWLGPNRDGASAEKVAAWKNDLKAQWKKAVGEGHSSPVIANGKVYLHTRVAKEDKEEVTAYDAKTGDLVWTFAYDRGDFKGRFGLGPRATPTVADGKIYTFGVTGILYCVDAEKGKEVWHVDTLKEFKAKNLGFGMSGSPLVEGDLVLVNVGGEGASVVAFKKNSGEVAWKTLDDKASYASPIALGKGKERQVVFLTAAGLVSLDPKDGSVYWKEPLVDLLNESSTTPVRIGDDLLLASSVTFGSMGVRLEPKDGKPSAARLWKNPELTCYFSTPVPVGKDYVYMVTGALSLTAAPSSTLRCVEAKSGQEKWKKEKVAKYHAALLRTGDDKLLMLDDNGNLILIDPDPEKYKELARSKVCGQTWAHPALSDGRVFLRDEKELMCVPLGP